MKPQETGKRNLLSEIQPDEAEGAIPQDSLPSQNRDSTRRVEADGQATPPETPFTTVRSEQPSSNPFAGVRWVPRLDSMRQSLAVAFFVLGSVFCCYRAFLDCVLPYWLSTQASDQSFPRHHILALPVTSAIIQISERLNMWGLIAKFLAVCLGQVEVHQPCKPCALYTSVSRSSKSIRLAYIATFVPNDATPVQSRRLSQDLYRMTCLGLSEFCNWRAAIVLHWLGCISALHKCSSLWGRDLSSHKHAFF